MIEHLPYEASDDTRNLRRRLRQGEHVNQDFKQTISDYRKIARAVVAFANQKGGSLFIGVDDRGGLTGVSARSEYYKLVEVLDSYCQPAVDAECLAYETEGKEILEVIVPEGLKKPYAALDKDGRWTSYLRIGDTNKKIGSR